MPAVAPGAFAHPHLPTQNYQHQLVVFETTISLVLSRMVFLASSVETDAVSININEAFYD